MLPRHLTEIKLKVLKVKWKSKKAKTNKNDKFINVLKIQIKRNVYK